MARFTIVNDENDKPILVSKSLQEQKEKKLQQIQEQKRKQQEQQNVQQRQDLNDPIKPSSAKFTEQQPPAPSQSPSSSGSYPSIYPELPSFPSSTPPSPKPSVPGYDPQFSPQQSPLYPSSPVADVVQPAPYMGQNYLLLDLRDEYERKLQHYQMLWRKNIEEMDRLNKDLLKKNKELFTNEVKRIDDKLLKKHFGDSKSNKKTPGEMPCKEFEEKLVHCFQINGKQSLLCSQLIQDFSNCIDKARMEMLKQK